MKLVHISDSHISHLHPEREKNLEACVSSINSSQPAADVVIHTGDIVHDGRPDEYITAHRLLNKLNAPYFVMGGNRDRRETLINEFADGQYIKSNNTYIQYAVEQFDVRLIVIDTMSDHSNKGRICHARMAHLASMLNENPTKPTAVFMHHTPFRVGAIPDPEQFEDWDDVHKLRDLLDQHQQITGIYCGHIHRSIEGMLGRHPVHAISCMASDLRKGEMSPEERAAPMLKFHEFNTTALSENSQKQ